MRRQSAGAPHHLSGKMNMSFAIYLLGFVILLAGVIWAMTAAGIPSLWIGIVALILLGLGIITGVSSTRSKDPPQT
jgi:membrane-bound acyltransferase YfiQ involved in biofilm formation